MTDETIATDMEVRKKPQRPRAVRYKDKTPREVALSRAQDEWVTSQMTSKWSRNQVLDNCIAMAMARMGEAAEKGDGVAESIGHLQESVDALARQVRTILAILTVDTKLRYKAANEPAPTSFSQHKSMVQDTVNRMMKDGANDSAQ